MSLIDTLRAEILGGALPPGTVLLQTDLANRFGLSRIPVRDALQRLAAERLVTVMPGKGAQVMALTRAELSEIYDLRALLETDLIHRAARKASPADHAEAAHHLQKSNLEAGRPGWAAGDWAFHAALYAPAQRPRHLALVLELRQACQIHSALYDKLISQTDQWLDDHAALFDMWSKGRADIAVSLLSQHIEAARDHLLSQIP